MPRGAYANPPITEAVLDLRIEPALPLPDLQKLKTRFTREYPNSEELVDWNVGFGPDPIGRITTQAAEIGRWYKLTSNDQADVIFLKPQNLSTSRLSPYRGWDSFFARAKRNYEIWRRSVGHQKIVRVATRYINRIDIPVRDLEKHGVESYFIVLPKLPGGRQSLKFFVQAMVSVPEIAATAIFNFGSIPSPLLDHVSFMLDIDLSRDHSIPTRGPDLWEMISQFRDYKNAIFEDSITDRARDLFDAD